MNRRLLSALALAAGLLPCVCQAEADPVPADLASLQIQRSLARSVPSNWSISEPQSTFDVPQIKIGIPDNWRGSPVSAAMSLCPDPDSDLWHGAVLQGAAVLRLVVHYKGRDWAPYDCRP
jgi:hypothetical protein